MQTSNKFAGLLSIRELKKMSTPNCLGPWLLEYVDGDRVVVNFFGLPYADELRYVSPIQTKIIENDDTCGTCHASLVEFFVYHWPIRTFACRILSYDRRRFVELVGGSGCLGCKSLDTQFDVTATLYNTLRKKNPDIRRLPALTQSKKQCGH